MDWLVQQCNSLVSKDLVCEVWLYGHTSLLPQLVYITNCTYVQEGALNGTKMAPIGVSLLHSKEVTMQREGSHASPELYIMVTYQTSAVQRLMLWKQSQSNLLC